MNWVRFWKPFRGAETSELADVDGVEVLRRWRRGILWCVASGWYWESWIWKAMVLAITPLCKGETLFLGFFKG